VRSADIRSFVPIEAEPLQAVDDPRHHLPRRSLGVGVFDTQHERAAVTTGVEPVEESRPGPADVEIARWRRRTPDADHTKGDCTARRFLLGELEDEQADFEEDETDDRQLEEVAARDRE